ncbi:acyltransferase [Clostridium sp. HBUAS56010]|uniref:acyltransferase family protein n=1 Tax=Clostridium sp. HBUAS56010 TaxID=2571127 RepID=UPI00117766F2|nr:acyltransferase [Clostridium sp. HBUAS56010]
MENTNSKIGFQRLTCLDGLRGIVCCCVAFFWHYQHFSPSNFPFSHIAYWPYHYGWLAVEFFFLLSGYIFFYKYSKPISEGTISFRNFFILRFSRLYPLHFVTLTVVMLFQWYRIFQGKDFFIYSNNNLYHFLLNIFFIQNGWIYTDWSFNAPSWSVSVELLAYFLFYQILKNIGKIGNNVYAAFIALIYLGLILQIFSFNVPLFNSQVGRIIFCFFTGCLLSKLQGMILAKQKQLLFSCICGAILLFHFSAILIFGYEFAIVKMLGNYSIVYSVLFFPCIILLALNSSVVNKILSLAPFRFLGDISYSIYLIHYPIQLALVTIFPFFNYSERKIFFVYIILVIIFSSISYYFFEKRLQTYIRSKAKLTNT